MFKQNLFVLLGIYQNTKFRNITNIIKGEVLWSYLIWRLQYKVSCPSHSIWRLQNKVSCPSYLIWRLQYSRSEIEISINWVLTNQKLDSGSFLLVCCHVAALKQTNKHAQSNNYSTICHIYSTTPNTHCLRSYDVKGEVLEYHRDFWQSLRDLWDHLMCTCDVWSENKFTIHIGK
jgi:hypothetical protein